MNCRLEILSLKLGVLALALGLAIFWRFAGPSRGVNMNRRLDILSLKLGVLALAQGLAISWRFAGPSRGVNMNCCLEIAFLKLGSNGGICTALGDATFG